MLYKITTHVHICTGLDSWIKSEMPRSKCVGQSVGSRIYPIYIIFQLSYSESLSQRELKGLLKGLYVTYGLLEHYTEIKNHGNKLPHIIKIFLVLTFRQKIIGEFASVHSL